MELLFVGVIIGIVVMKDSFCDWKIIESKYGHKNHKNTYPYNRTFFLVII